MTALILLRFLLVTLTCTISSVNSQYATTGTFLHPGTLHTPDDLARMAAKVAAKETPWIEGYQQLQANYHCRTDYVPRPVVNISRCTTGCANNAILLSYDAVAAYSLALTWHITNQTIYAVNSIRIMKAWSSTLQRVDSASSFDAYLMSTQMTHMVHAGELMRDYAGWNATDLDEFRGMVRNIFYPLASACVLSTCAIGRVYANWQLTAMGCLMAIGVFLDDPTIWQIAIDNFYAGWWNGAIANAVYAVLPGMMGEMQESGRDQGHNTLDVGLLAAVCEMGWNQGYDLYGYDNNRALASFEYVAKGNLAKISTTAYTVPYTPYIGENINNYVWSTSAQGIQRPTWSMPFHHYAHRKGIAAPYTKAYMSMIGAEGGGVGAVSGGYDQIGFGTLANTRDPPSMDIALPSGLIARVSLGVVQLSWWGTIYSTSYSVLRSLTSGGPYDTIATGIRDLLTYADIPPTNSTWYYVIQDRTLHGATRRSNEVRASNWNEMIFDLEFDEPASPAYLSNNITVDSSAYGHTAILQNGAYLDTGSGSGWNSTWSRAVYLSNGAYVELPPGLLADVGDMTLTFWMQWNGFYSGVQHIFSFGTNRIHSFWMCPKYSDGTSRVYLTNADQKGGDLLQNGRMADRSWTHVAVVIAGRNFTAYQNGNVWAHMTDLKFQPWTLGNTTYNYIGRQSPGYGAAGFVGAIDKFRIYRGAMSDQQIYNLMASHY